MDPRAKAEYPNENWAKAGEPEFELTEEESDEEEAVARALADFQAGRFVEHAEVERWLRSWGTANKLPKPKCG